jgi:hypothetical protein
MKKCTENGVIQHKHWDRDFIIFLESFANKNKSPPVNLSSVFFPLSLILPPLTPSCFLIWLVTTLNNSPVWRVSGKKLVHISGLKV